MSFFTPFTNFIILWTEYTPDEPASTKHKAPSFAQRIYRMSMFSRLVLLELLLNTYQGTLLRNFLVSLNTFNQTAYQLLQAGQSALPAITQFYTQFPYFAGISLAICIVTYLSRTWRTSEFYKTDKTLIKTVYGNMDESVDDSIKNISKGEITQRYEKNVVNLAKSYFNLTQNMVLAPFEILMYLSILGPQLVSVIVILAIISGYCMKLIDRLGRKTRQEQDSAQAELKQASDSDFLKLTADYSKLSHKAKLLEILQDLTTRTTTSVFILAQMFICSQLLFAGQYDIAMYVAQTTVGLQAYQRIMNYIKLIPHYGKFSQDLEKQTNLMKTVLKDRAEKLPQYQTSHNGFYWSASHRGILYSAMLITALGYQSIPVSQYLLSISALAASISTQQFVGAIALIWLTTSIIFKDTDTSSVDSSVLSYTLQVGFIASASIILLNTWPFIIPTLMQVPMLHRVAYLTVVSSSLYVIDKHLRTKLLFMMDYIGTWISQEAFNVVKLPVESARMTASGAKKTGSVLRQVTSSITQGAFNLV